MRQQRHTRPSDGIKYARFQKIFDIGGVCPAIIEREIAGRIDDKDSKQPKNRDTSAVDYFFIFENQFIIEFERQENEYMNR